VSFDATGENQDRSLSAEADLNCDGVADVPDLSMLISLWRP
jgi:hypothetical protein